MKKVTKNIFLKLILNILNNYMNFIMIYHFYIERMKIERFEKFVANIHDKIKYVIHIKTDIKS